MPGSERTKRRIVSKSSKRKNVEQTFDHGNSLRLGLSQPWEVLDESDPKLLTGFLWLKAPIRTLTVTTVNFPSNCAK